MSDIQVQALYQFRSTDDDELSFDKGDVVHVIVHPDPEEQVGRCSNSAAMPNLV